MNKPRYTLTRVYYNRTPLGKRLATEEIDCKTLKDAKDEDIIKAKLIKKFTKIYFKSLYNL